MLVVCAGGSRIAGRGRDENRRTERSDIRVYPKQLRHSRTPFPIRPSYGQRRRIRGLSRQRRWPSKGRYMMKKKKEKKKKKGDLRRFVERQQQDHPVMDGCFISFIVCALLDMKLVTVSRQASGADGVQVQVFGRPTTQMEKKSAVKRPEATIVLDRDSIHYLPINVPPGKDGRPVTLTDLDNAIKFARARQPTPIQVRTKWHVDATIIRENKVELEVEGVLWDTCKKLDNNENGT